MSASPWTKATITDDDPGDIVRSDAEGTSHIRYLSEKFRHHDVDGDFGILGVGVQVIE
jgi:hypothetical protein